MEQQFPCKHRSSKRYMHLFTYPVGQAMFLFIVFSVLNPKIKMIWENTSNGYQQFSVYASLEEAAVIQEAFEKGKRIKAIWKEMGAS